MLHNSTTNKVVSAFVGIAMLAVAMPVGAQTQSSTDLQAQINSLLQTIASLQQQLAAVQGGSAGTTTVQGSFTMDLKIGSNGAEVVRLQDYLQMKGYLVMPAGVAKGYFGALTKSAVMKWQAAMGLPATGFFGPMSRAKINAVVVVNPGTGTGTGTGTTGTGITTPGMEGTVSVTTNNSGLVSTVYEGDMKAAVFGFNVEAKGSDVAVQRVKVDLGTNTKIYTKGYSRMYLMDGSTVLATVDLNSSNVIKDGTHYYTSFAGFNALVKKGEKKQFVLKADVMGSIDSGDRTTLSSISIDIPQNGVRAIDGAGIDQYAPASGSLGSRSVTFSATLSESATLKMSVNSSTPKKADVVAAAGASENELDKLTTLVFDLRAEKDNVKVTDMRVGVVKSGAGAATAQTAYLYDGTTEIDSASISSGMATFSDIDLMVSKDTTKTLSVKVDFRNADATIANFVTSASTTIAADLVAENSQADSVTVSGSATGNQIGIRNVGAEITLVSKSITTSGVPQGSGSNASATSTLTATFNVKVKAVGGDLNLGTSGSSTPMFAAASSFKLYINGSVSSANLATSTSYTIPSTCATAGLTNSCVLSEGQEITIPVTFQVPGRSITTGAISAGIYSVGLEKVWWNGTDQSATFMAGDVDWRTSEVSFP